NPTTMSCFCSLAIQLTSLNLNFVFLPTEKQRQGEKQTLKRLWECPFVLRAVFLFGILMVHSLVLTSTRSWYLKSKEPALFPFSFRSPNTRAIRLSSVSETGGSNFAVIPSIKVTFSVSGSERFTSETSWAIPGSFFLRNAKKS